MLQRPSARRKTASEGIALNLVPILDTMVTLIGFLLFTTSFLAIVAIESPFPQINPSQLPEQLKEKPLQLTLTLGEKESEIWSPFERIPTQKIAHSEDGHPDLKKIHEALLEVKKQFPIENKIIIVPTASTAYDTLVAIMDSVRKIETTDAPIFVKNEKTGTDEAIKGLFPEVIFGNLLGDS